MLSLCTVLVRGDDIADLQGNCRLCKIPNVNDKNNLSVLCVRTSGKRWVQLLGMRVNLWWRKRDFGRFSTSCLTFTPCTAESSPSWRIDSDNGEMCTQLLNRVYWHVSNHILYMPQPNKLPSPLVLPPWLHRVYSLMQHKKQ